MKKKYFINTSDRDELMPEETLLDSGSLYPKMEFPVGRSIWGMFYVSIFVISIIFILSAFNLQIMQGESYASLAELNSFVKYPLMGLRGAIYSSDGELLAGNKPVFEVVSLVSQIPKEEVLNKNISLLAEIIDMTEEEIREKIDKNKNKAVFVLKGGLSKDEALAVEEAGMEGVYVIANSKRSYPKGELFSQVLGYVSGVSEDNISRDNFYLPGDKIGTLGVEEEYERYLRGVSGAVYFKNSNKDVVLSEPGKGGEVYLNINSDVQEKLHESLEGVLRSQGLRVGSAVVQNPKTGEVIALSSFPAYDNNVFSNIYEEDFRDDVKKILSDSKQPLFNRAIGGRYSPGSTIKPLLALAALKEGVVTPSTIIYSGGSIQISSEIDPSVVYTFGDWKVHGWTDIYKAIADSVDVYFYALGGGYQDIVGLGIDKMHSYISGAMADKKLGIDLVGEANGLVPSRDWKKKTKGEDWYRGDSYNVSIGQGDLFVTPLWINSYIGAIANGGDIMKPLVVDKIVENHGSEIINNPEVIGRLKFDKDTLNIVKIGMRRAVESGTARILDVVPVELAAKTGTAQVSGNNLNSLLTVFGPYEDPEIIITIIVENIGDEQGLALRMAREFLNWYFTEYKGLKI
ncbi:MAG: hypothetical protein COV29_03045 [Candidatus Yanofskybacteria bacterium CG10_big_fil_rev_8_21_14_0_10_36_16]|uniref:Penicillin-binding protein 2 n=1 Tax=Candidatus Yanofskybacteria bacterium CG10_big_fil_rev_8_21_14_0_10_36_16 TaxID=1975096 RepID=A0A2J0Q9M0_9BACT|nr:MAG: hypothetical protein COV29_03045 [Candidatus Yanofskybacteria bacterium CG10_big_fil_rev_8_21_14_0_10_36_16]